eukprot:CAMPEP_0183447644 /NCGR_PEP_ID=MMETSP0370-20130417/103326_1 /TAXON_ID=268820 /ORGANISM="Peridinium aciculiferum, Strain PAER-2" /LENGTH=157 /DNA_ID=CAMNT_0025638519 /DNA_START=45 /DNA_END=514 /DNA_ORIENTATION=+
MELNRGIADGGGSTPNVPGALTWDSATGAYASEDIPDDIRALMGGTAGTQEAASSSSVPERLERALAARPDCLVQNVCCDEAVRQQLLRGEVPMDEVARRLVDQVCSSGKDESQPPASSGSAGSTAACGEVQGPEAAAAEAAVAAAAVAVPAAPAAP